jgi:MscS family membrane protein
MDRNESASQSSRFTTPNLILRGYTAMLQFPSAKLSCRFFTVPAICAALILVVFSCHAWCQMSSVLAQKSDDKEKSAPSVKVEVKEAGEEKGREVKVEVNGKKVEPGSEGGKPKAGLKALTDAETRVIPVDTEKIDEVGKKAGEKIDEITEEASFRLGSWVKSKAFNGITWFKLIATILAFLLLLVFERTVSHFILKRLERVDREDEFPMWSDVLLEAVHKPLCAFIWIYGTYAVMSPLLVHFEKPFQLEDNVPQLFAKTVADIGGLLVAVWFVFRVIRLVDVELESRAKAPESKIDDLQVSLVGKTLRWVIVVVGTILIVRYVTGFKASALIASLGLGGLAVALAAKESIENLLGTITIVFDRPFRMGDRVKIDDYDGFVESVGYRSTKIRLWNGNLVNMPNKKIIDSSLVNFARRPHIWWRTNMTITYDTPPEKVDSAVQIIQEILESDEWTSRENPPWVFFNGFNDWSLNIRITAWFEPPDAREPRQFDYHSWRQRNCRKILRRFAEEGIQFAFPTNTTYLANDDSRQLKLLMLGGERNGPSENPTFSDDLVAGRRMEP